jgi:hypothetical protein
VGCSITAGILYQYLPAKQSPKRREGRKKKKTKTTERAHLWEDDLDVSLSTVCDIQIMSSSFGFIVTEKQHLFTLLAAVKRPAAPLQTVNLLKITEVSNLEDVQILCTNFYTPIRLQVKLTSATLVRSQKISIVTNDPQKVDSSHH